jgi:hypothetical protein
VSLIRSSIVIVGEELLNVSKTMKIPSEKWLYLGKRLGMMMKSRSVDLYRIIKILVWLQKLVSDKSFIETCDFLTPHAIRLDQRFKEKAARQIHNAS